ncbi:hypothetical protein GTR02_15980 [Kineococcus sp. R8]|uniref:hypothetical protein n=1 Tax=Kineococcus siccus TaxID=2696567 RepID=UPI0014123F95|nr:hypothetical protein [Kineococcus siccus]NAZ83319.1 hypothetical protein [Kineococcus siccus]
MPDALTEELPDDLSPEAVLAADARLGAELSAVWEVLAAADPAVSVQDALAVLADLRLRPVPAAVPAVRPGSLAAWRPAGTPVPPRPEREAEAVAVTDALSGGRLLRVVNFHDTPLARRAELAAEFAWYAERFDPVGEADVHAFLDTGRWASTRPGLVPAFYDGFASAAQVAVPLCEEFGFTGWFYPPTEFLGVPAAEQRAFAARHHYGVLDDEPGGRLAMTWDELADLATRHVVCGHTATHAASAAVTTAAEVEREVLAPLTRLQEVTGRVPASWAWLGGSPHDATRPGDRAVAAAGVRLVTSNAALQRLPAT